MRKILGNTDNQTRLRVGYAAAVIFIICVVIGDATVDVVAVVIAADVVIIVGGVADVVVAAFGLFFAQSTDYQKHPNALSLK